MSRSWLLYLDDLIDSAEKIGRFVAGRTLDTFRADEAILDAVLFNLQVIGEAVKHLPEQARAAAPELVGAGPARLRDLIAHHYFALDVEIIWEVATSHVPRILVQAYALREQTTGDVTDAGGARMNRHVNAITGRLSLRPPQRHSREILDFVAETTH